MINLIETIKLKEHHKNGYYFTDIEGEKYEEVKRSIEAQGIRDPIKCTRDYTVISGHQRLRIARDLGMEKVPYQMLDVDERKAEYLLIAENTERRGEAEKDPIKKSRIAKFLQEYWNVREGSAGKRSLEGQNALQKTTSDIADMLGESERNTKRILKLHDLIPQLQRLVSAGKLGTTAGEQLAHLSPEVQSALYDVLGEEIANKTVKETQELRKELNGKEIEVIKAELEKMTELERQARQEAQEVREELERAKEANPYAEQPYGVKLGLAMYDAFEELSKWQKEYSWIITDATEFQKLVESDPNFAREFSRLDKFWQQMSAAFNGVRSKGTYREESETAEIVDVEFTEVI